ncbi:MAG: DUF3165 domain-containing protein [Streptococcaceae bacterium]|nr:DUF3165 domain-containing protein [Streptococcaceae bacterium]
MPKDVRRSTDIFAIGAVVVLVIAFGVALLFKYHGPIIEIAVVLALLALMIKSILEIENL